MCKGTLAKGEGFDKLMDSLFANKWLLQRKYVKTPCINMIKNTFLYEAFDEKIVKFLLLYGIFFIASIKNTQRLYQ